MAGLPRKGLRNTAVIEAVVVDGMTMKAAAKKFGISDRRVSQILKRDGGEDVSVSRALRVVHTDGLIAKGKDAIDRILDSITDDDIRNAPLNQRTVAMGIISQNVLLWEGKATVIFGNDRREQVNDLTAQLMAEAKRRGVTIDAVATEVENDRE